MPRPVPTRAEQHQRVNEPSLTKLNPPASIRKQHKLPKEVILDTSKATLFNVFQVSFDKTAKTNNKRKNISKRELLQVLHLPQTQACSLLRCSLSTLKRRFYELKDEFGIDRWPQYMEDIRHLPIFPKIYPLSMTFILNEAMQDETLISKDVLGQFSKNSLHHSRDRNNPRV